MSSQDEKMGSASQQMEPDEPDAKTSIITISPIGDRILSIGPEKKRFRVHTGVLSNASKAFRALLGPHFREGQDTMEDISLPEDDPEILEIIFNVVHIRNNAIPSRLAPQKLFQLAISADKWGFMEAFRFSSSQWLDPQNTTSTEELACFMASAYLFNNAYWFERITKRMIFYHADSYLSLVHLQICEFVPFQILVLLQEQRSSLKVLLQDTLLRGGYLSGSLNKEDGVFGKYALAYGKLLDDYALSPMDLHDDSIATIIKSMGRVLDQSHLPKALHRCSSSKFDPQPEGPPVFSTSWKSQMKDISRKKGITISDVFPDNPVAT